MSDLPGTNLILGPGRQAHPPTTRRWQPKGCMPIRGCSASDMSVSWRLPMAAMVIPALNRPYCFAPYIYDGRAPFLWRNTGCLGPALAAPLPPAPPRNPRGAVAEIHRGAILGPTPRRQHPEGHIFFQFLRQAPERQYPRGIAIDQYLHHHSGRIRQIP